jgi:TYPE III RESTRICTION-MODIFICATION SYSTEM METHYLATION SUBUNIT
MQTDTQKYNESIKPNSKEIEILKKYFPQCFSKPETDENGTVIKEHFDTEKLAELINKNEVDIKKEGFTLNFLGKSYARYQANLDSETVIVPDEQNAETNSENVYIVGDNLDALQHLKYSYAEKIKCIYIDPPYNTGKEDFVYNDKFGFTAKDLVEKLDVTEEEAERICSMNGKCTHSAWLTFMYPRLALARELLRDDGVIFISIDDNEQANLKRLCDETFGEGNFVGEITVVANPRGRDYGGVARMHDYILCYKKSDLCELNLIKDENNEFKMFDERGGFELRELRNRNVKFNKENRPNLYYPFYINPKELDEYGLCTIDLTAHDGWIELFPLESQGINVVWRWGKEKSLKNLNTEIKAKPMKNGSFMIVEKYRESRMMARSVWWDKVSNTENGTLLVKELFEGKIFDYPKPIEMVMRVCEMGSYVDSSDIILDFFSGSATTAHAVMQLNAQDGGSRKFIMVQLDEPVKKGSEAEKAGYKTIDEIGRARIRRAAEKIKAENPEIKADLGFQTFYLKSMPQNTLDKIKTFNPKDLFTSDGDIVKTLGEDTLLQTWQLKDGFGFNCNRKEIDIADCAAYLLEDEKIGKYLYLLTGMEEEAVKELIRKIESFELTADKIFVYGYSFDFDALNSLSTNLKTLKNRNPIEPIIRY